MLVVVVVGVAVIVVGVVVGGVVVFMATVKRCKHYDQNMQQLNK